MTQPTHRPSIVGALLFGALTAVSACGGASGATNVAASAQEAPASAASTENSAHSAEFLGHKEATLRLAQTQGPDAVAEAERLLLSAPIDITEPGHYMLKAGPLPASAVGDLAVRGGATPGDEHEFLEMRWDRGMKDGAYIGPRIVEEGGERYATMPFTVTKVRSPYYGYRGWLEWGDARLDVPARPGVKG